MKHSHGVHHLHTRKRKPDARAKHLKEVVDRIAFVVGVIGPLLTLPQVWIIWAHQQVNGLSLVTWSSYVLNNIFWIYYGFLHEEKPIIVMYFFWLVVNLSVVFGIFVFS